MRAATANGEVRRCVLVALRKILGDCLLHGHASLHRLLGGGEGGHDLIADGFNDGAVMSIDLFGHQVQALGYQLTGDGIAEGFVEACAAADVRKYDRPRSGLFRHAQTVLRASNPIIRCRYPPSPALQITSMAEAASYTYVFDSYDKGRSRRVMKQVTGED
jgi:hypothetical protein